MPEFSDLTWFSIACIILGSVGAFLYAAASTRREGEDLINLMNEANQIRADYQKQIEELQDS